MFDAVSMVHCYNCAGYEHKSRLKARSSHLWGEIQVKYMRGWKRVGNEEIRVLYCERLPYYMGAAKYNNICHGECFSTGTRQSLLNRLIFARSGNTNQTKSTKQYCGKGILD